VVSFDPPAWMLGAALGVMFVTALGALDPPKRRRDDDPPRRRRPRR